MPFAFIMWIEQYKDGLRSFYLTVSPGDRGIGGNLSSISTGPIALTCHQTRIQCQSSQLSISELLVCY